MNIFGRNLGNESTQTSDERRAEANRIIKIIIECDLVMSDLTSTESSFVTRLADDPTASVSPKQLYWLRDIKSKYCE